MASKRSANIRTISPFSTLAKELGSSTGDSFSCFQGNCETFVSTPYFSAFLLSTYLTFGLLQRRRATAARRRTRRARLIGRRRRRNAWRSSTVATRGSCWCAVVAAILMRDFVFVWCSVCSRVNCDANQWFCCICTPVLAD